MVGRKRTLQSLRVSSTVPGHGRPHEHSNYHSSPLSLFRCRLIPWPNINMQEWLRNIKNGLSLFGVTVGPLPCVFRWNLQAKRVSSFNISETWYERYEQYKYEAIVFLNQLLTHETEHGSTGAKPKSLESSWVAWSLQCDGCEVTDWCLSCPTWPQPSDSLQALEIVMTWCPLLAMLRKECQIDVGMWRPIPFPGRFYTANYNHFNFWTVEVIGVIELLVLLDASWLA